MRVAAAMSAGAGSRRPGVVLTAANWSCAQNWSGDSEPGALDVSRAGRVRGLPIGVASVQDSIDGDAFDAIVNGEQGAMVADAQPVPIGSSQLVDLMASRLSGKLLNPLQDALPLRVGQRAQVFFDAGIVGERVHELERPGSLQTLQQFIMGNEAVAAADSPTKKTRILSIVGLLQEPLVIREGQNDRFRLTVTINDQMIRRDADGHVFLQRSGATRGNGHHAADADEPITRVEEPSMRIQDRVADPRPTMPRCAQAGARG